MTGRDLETIRAAMGLTQAAAAAKFGVSQEFWSMMEGNLKFIPSSLEKALNSETKKGARVDEHSSAGILGASDARDARTDARPMRRRGR